VEESGAEFPVPSFVFQEFLIDQVFAQAMTETVERIERGQGVLSLADTHARWGREDGRSGTFSHTSRPYGSGYSPRQSARPQMDASPTLDPTRPASARTSRASRIIDGGAAALPAVSLSRLPRFSKMIGAFILQRLLDGGRAIVGLFGDLLACFWICSVSRAASFLGGSASCCAPQAHRAKVTRARSGFMTPA
jgi:hypothetical protein